MTNIFSFTQIQRQKILEEADLSDSRYWKLLKGRSLEVALVSILSRYFHTKLALSPRSHDRGIDLWGKKSDGRLILIQCKGWGRPVGEPPVREFAGACQIYRGDKSMWFIAPNGFTPRAEKLSNALSIMPIEGDLLAGMCKAALDYPEI